MSFDEFGPFRKLLFKRTWAIRVGVPGLESPENIYAADISELDCEFRVVKDLTAEPNTCELVVYNMPSVLRAALDQASIYDPKRKKNSQSNSSKGKSTKPSKSGRIRVEIEAGYENTARPLIFSGDIRRAISSRQDDGGWRTVITGGDAGVAIQAARVTQSFPSGTTKEVIVRQLLDAMGVGAGNILQVLSQLAGTVYSRGTTISGRAVDELRRICRSERISFSVHDGAAVFVLAGQGLQRRAVVLDASSGLIGEPEKDSTGLVSARSLMNPDLSCGGYVQLQSTQYDGNYYISKIEYKGATAGNDWYCDLELQAG